MYKSCQIRHFSHESYSLLHFVTLHAAAVGGGGGGA
jgi:hypothetical protein